MRYHRTQGQSTAGSALSGSFGSRRRFFSFIITLLIACAVAVSAPVGLGAQEADVVYTEGDVRTKTLSGSIQDTYIGDPLRAGESVITGRTGFAELQQSDYRTIQVFSDTCFVIQEKEVDGEKRQVMETTTGSVFFRFQKMAEKEPIIQSPSYVCGVRGTEFTVYAGADGSSMILVDQGLVDVEAEGKTVSVTADQGVEVAAGEAPGEVFERKGKAIDFSEWNATRTKFLEENPIEGLKRVRNRYSGLRDNYGETYKLYLEIQSEVEKTTQDFFTKKYSGNEAEAQKIKTEELTPLINQRNSLYLNARYYALSALSLRRYILGSMYIKIKTLYGLGQNNELFAQFTEEYNAFLADFEEHITPRLVDRDI